jgi:hypothetical protein
MITSLIICREYRKDRDWAVEMGRYMTENAKNSGLDFQLGKAT